MLILNGVERDTITYIISRANAYYLGHDMIWIKADHV